MKNSIRPSAEVEFRWVEFQFVERKDRILPVRPPLTYVSIIIKNTYFSRFIRSINNEIKSVYESADMNETLKIKKAKNISQGNSKTPTVSYNTGIYMLKRANPISKVRLRERIAPSLIKRESKKYKNIDF